MIPWAALPWAKIAAGAAIMAAVGSGIAWHVHRVDLAREQGTTAGQTEVRAQWDKATPDPGVVLADVLGSLATAGAELAAEGDGE